MVLGNDQHCYLPDYLSEVLFRTSTMGLQWYVGIDLVKRQHRMCLLEREGDCCAQYSISHTGQGFLDLTTWLSEHSGRRQLRRFG